MVEQLQGLYSEAMRTGRRVPFVELMRFLRRDPYFRVSVYMPTLKLREFYHSYLMIRVLSQLDSRFPDIRRGVVDRMVEELFGGPPPPFTYFRPGVQVASDRTGLPGFRHMRSLNLLYAFLPSIHCYDPPRLGREVFATGYGLKDAIANADSQREHPASTEGPPAGEAVPDPEEDQEG